MASSGRSGRGPADVFATTAEAPLGVPLPVERYRVWRLYLAGARLAFAENRMGLDRFLAVRPDTGGASAMPASREVIVVPRPPKKG